MFLCKTPTTAMSRKLLMGVMVVWVVVLVVMLVLEPGRLPEHKPQSQKCSRCGTAS